MRKLFYVIVLSLGCGSLFAHNGSITNSYSDLNIKMWDNSSFIITLDHDISHRTRSFSLKNVSPGGHFVKIVKRKKNNHGNGGFVQTIYEGRINIPSKRKVFVKVEGRNRLSFKFFKKPNHNNHNNGHGNHNNNNSHNNHNNTYGSGHNSNWDSGCEPVNSNNGHYGQTNFGNNSYSNNYGPVVMSNNSFNRLMDILKEEHFDDDRLGIARQALSLNNMNVNQVSAIMDQLTFDKSKLAFAKSAYSKTIDKENFFVINGKFTFSSSVSDLNNYIRHNA
ncbi:DUF4476 domain-containing protein [Vicingaceae bacterium]|nr:DUF4476 domain-containing protein [Vicingaceae bacterium]